MSAATLERETAPAQRKTGRELLHGMPWLVWRQHRGAVWAGLALLVALAAAAVYLRHGTTTFVQQHDIAGCTLFSGPERCAENQEAIQLYRTQYQDLVQILLVVVLALPYLAGLFVGAPLVARELEAGTHRVAWSQSVPPQRWLLHKLLLPLAGLVLLCGLAAWLASWVLAGAGQATLGIYWYSALAFAPTGPALVGYAALGIALGGAAGLLIRRTVPAMVATLLALGGVTLLLQFLRPQLASPITHVSKAVPQLAEDSWVLSAAQRSTAGGETFPANLCADARGDALRNCLAEHGATYYHTEYHPLSQMRQIQFTEGALCLGLAALLVALTWWWLRRRAL
ncbi:ABC transporter permease subunit [Streptomyces iconiensis]|uniref:ABC transporter permease subunit n=1 Tax=Streptomyces iconiensis TaxID=1384038 RepID=A0ABT6ZT09_9ACTN|nr:ABC transporter permease subunit [Streptomyces iconiensis]MDJ1132203.1 ABC transporter permease subunit [Streptomyces iconiensis]